MLYFDCFLQNTTTATTMAATMVTTTSRRMTHVTTAMTVTSVGGSVGMCVWGGWGYNATFNHHRTFDVHL